MGHDAQEERFRTVQRTGLAEVLRQSDQIHELIRQSAEALISTGRTTDPAAANNDLRAHESVFGANEAVARKLHEASAGLRAVHLALRAEIRDRNLVNHQLAAALEQEEGARHAALHDPLTGLPNRVLLRDRLDHGIAHAKRHRWTLAVMFVDIDNFKDINDTYGHLAGDAALQTVANRLTRNTRNDDTVSRYGGDEFVCLLTRPQDPNDVAIIAAKVLTAIRAPCELRVGDSIVNLCLEASIGVSLFPTDGAGAAALITCADHAMYRAKESKSRVEFAEEKAVRIARAVTHRQPTGQGIPSGNAARVLDIESPGNNQSLQGEGCQKVRAH